MNNQLLEELDLEAVEKKEEEIDPSETLLPEDDTDNDDEEKLPTDLD